ncbi:MAG: hypothetical protein ACOCVX_04330 [Bacteroidales bacterium]
MNRIIHNEFLSGSYVVSVFQGSGNMVVFIGHGLRLCLLSATLHCFF